MTALPTPRALLSSLLPPLPESSPIVSSPTSTATLPPSSKPLILTLHCLFPNELLPALDLLDRRLVTRFVFEGKPRHSPEPGHMKPTSELSAVAPPQETVPPSRDPVESLDGSKQTSGQYSIYYVRSSQQPRSRFSSKRNEASASEGTSYEVRLQAWNCSCAAFAFAAFSREWDRAETVDEGGGIHDEGPRQGGKESQEWQVGGVSLGEDVPICKHLLACVLAERVDGLSTFVDEKAVGRGELAGWAAGWGG